jgi:hypothetical protein
MNSCDLVATVTAFACAIAKCVSRDELATITAVLGQLAATLGTIAVQEDIINKKTEAEPSPIPEPDTEIIVETETSVPTGNA